MIKRFFLLLFLSSSIKLYSQDKNSSNKLGFLIPIVWNNSNGVYYSLGRRKEPSGNAASYGININYSHFVYKNFFVIGGVGYYRQRFNIQRPFQYRTPDGSEPLVSTTNYSYHNIHFLLGVGYQKNINEKWAVTGQLYYNIYNTYKQKYEQGYAPGKNEVYKKNFMLGKMINLDMRCERYINNRVSLGAAIVLPVYTHWNDDTIFYKYDYANDTQIAAETKFSLGANLSFYYKLKR